MLKTLPKLNKKTLFIHGETDLRVSTDAVFEHIKLLPITPEVQIIEGFGHSITSIENNYIRIFLRNS